MTHADDERNASRKKIHFVALHIIVNTRSYGRADCAARPMDISNVSAGALAYTEHTYEIQISSKKWMISHITNCLTSEIWKTQI